MIIGHIAAAVIIKRYVPETNFVPLVLGSMLPDIGDKTIKEVRQIYEGRSFFHSFIGLAASSALIKVLFRGPQAQKAGSDLLLGYVGHLVCDTGGDLPLLYPFIPYQFRFSTHGYKEKIIRVFTHPKPAEAFLMIWAALIVIEWGFSLIRTNGSKNGRI